MSCTDPRCSHMLEQFILLYMLERLLEQKTAITASNAECQLPTKPCSQQWDLIEKVVKLLKVFKEAAREISVEYSSASININIICKFSQKDYFTGG